MAKTWAGMLPLVAAGTPANGKMTAALTPGAAGPWMWPAVALELRPVQLALTVMVVSAAFRLTDAKPVAVEALAGTSWRPDMVTVNVCAVAAAGPAVRTTRLGTRAASTPATASTRAKRRARRRTFGFLEEIPVPIVTTFQAELAAIG